MEIKQGKPCDSSNYSSRNGSDIKYIVIHFTANNGDTAQNNCSYFNGANRNASAHYFVGDDGIYQSVQDGYKAWHCGGTSVYKHGYCRNANSIGIEMCSRLSGGEYYIKDNVISDTVALTKYLMNKYGIGADNVIRHYDVWDKMCPEPFVKHPEQWESFKKRLQESEDLTMTQYEELKQENATLKARLTKIENAIQANDVGDNFVFNYVDKNMKEKAAWAVEPVEWAIKKGVIKGVGTDVKGSPMYGLTKWKMWVITVIYRLLK